MYYLIYKTTNKINGKIYIGAHKTDDLEDGYLGSGKYIGNAIEKYGPKSFTREILETFDNPEDMYQLEAELVDEVFVNRKDTYNIKLGGQGGFDHLNTPEGIEKRSWTFMPWSIAGTKAFKKKMSSDPKFRSMMLKQARLAGYLGGKRIKELYPDGTWQGRKHTEETKKKMSKAKKGICIGKANSQFGTCWIYNEDLKENKKIPRTELDEWISKGWIKGRKMKPE